MASIECSIIVKDENKKLVNKFLVYDPLELDTENPGIKHMIQETLDQFKIEEGQERPSIVLKAMMVIQ